MLLKVFTNVGILAYKDIDKSFFRRRCAGGMKYLQFDISTRHPLYSYFHLEGQVEYLDDLYVIKGMNSRSKARICTVNCELDLNGLDSKKITREFTTVSFSGLCREILANTGWRIVDADLIGRRTTIEAQDNTPREILERCTNKTAFGTCYSFDNKNKVIYSIKPYNNTTPTGTYFTDEMNLDDLSSKGSSSGLFTKLYAYGKDGLTIASANGGLEYIENYSYTDRVIVKTWRDERYTDPYALLDDARVKLDAGAVPEISYQLKVIDLAKTKPEIYGNHLAYDLYDIVTLIDRDSRIRSDLRIVELCEYPADHTLDTVVISNVTGRISGKITTLANRLTELDAQQLHDRTKVNEIKQDLDTTVLHVSESWASSVNESLFTQTAEGLFLEVNKVVGTNRWSTLLQQSATDVKIAWNNISKYIQFESGELCIYDSAVPATQKLRAKFNESGNHFYRDDYYVGKIGTNNWDQYILLSSKPPDWETEYRSYYRKNRNTYETVTDSSAPTFTANTYYRKDISHKGLVFDLDYQGKYMAFAQKPSESDSIYTTMLCFSRANSIYSNYGMHLGCDMYGHNNTLHDVYLDGISVRYNGSNRSGYSGEITFVTGITSPTVSANVNNVTRNSDGAITDFSISVNVSVNYSSSKLRVSNGIVVGYWN
ncbi:phage minor structural protein, N-terminal region [Ruminococcaceae bacterium P7]|nr:phage minor structural protein, N-terminal region [Ruminococcaceae bacterium P7]